MISNWIKWHSLRIRKFFVLTFKLRVRKDLATPEAANKVAEQVEKFRAGKSTAYEGMMASEYLGLKGHFAEVRRMNTYFWSLLVLSAIGYGFWHAIGAPSRYTENRGVECPPDSSFWDCLGIYVDRFMNVPLLFLMVLILTFVIVAAIYEKMRRRGEAVSEQEFNDGKRWLTLLDEDARALTPWWMFLVLLMFLLLEAAAITLIASTFVADLSSEIELVVGVLVGCVCAIILGWLVHNAGAQLYRNRKRKELNLLTTEDKTEVKSMARTFSFTGRANYLYTIVSILVVVSFVGLAFVQRYNLNMDIIEDEVRALETDGELFGDAAIPEDIEIIEDANEEEFVGNSSKREAKGLVAALLVLSIIFVIVNFFGGWLGYHYSLYTEKSKKAYKDVRGYKKWTMSKNTQQSDDTKSDATLFRLADVFFAKYFGNLTNEADKVNEHDKLYEALERRGPWTMMQGEAMDSVGAAGAMGASVTTGNVS